MWSNTTCQISESHRHCHYLAYRQLAVIATLGTFTSANSHQKAASGPLFTKQTDVLPQDPVKSRKPRDLGLDFFNRPDIWQAPRQQRYRDACQIQILERYDH